MIGTVTTAGLLDRWLESRAVLRLLDEAEHPDIVDKYGRVWTWMDGEVYRHEGMAWPKWAFDDPDSYGLPSPELANNPNYQLCEICRQAWPKPEPNKE
jgi:hypothetical protein